MSGSRVEGFEKNGDPSGALVSLLEYDVVADGGIIDVFYNHHGTTINSSDPLAGRFAPTVSSEEMTCGVRDQVDLIMVMHGLHYTLFSLSVMALFHFARRSGDFWMYSNTSFS